MTFKANLTLLTVKEQLEDLLKELKDKDAIRIFHDFNPSKVLITQERYFQLLALESSDSVPKYNEAEKPLVEDKITTNQDRPKYPALSILRG